MNISLSLVLELFWLVLLVAFLRHFIREIVEINKARRWKKTRAEVTQCEIVKKGRGNWIKLLYHYQVDGKSYQSEQLIISNYFISPFSSYCKQHAYHWARAFKAGEKVDSFYCPDDPSQAVLARPKPIKLYLITVLLLFFTIFHLVLLFFTLNP